MRRCFSSTTNASLRYVHRTGKWWCRQVIVTYNAGCRSTTYCCCSTCAQIRRSVTVWRRTDLIYGRNYRLTWSADKGNWRHWQRLIDWMTAPRTACPRKNGGHSRESGEPVKKESPPATRYFTGCRVKPGMAGKRVTHYDSGLSHTAPVLPAGGEEGFGQLPQGTITHRVHEFREHVFIVDDRIADTLQGFVCLFPVAVLERRKTP